MRKSALYALGLVVAILVALGLVVLSSASEANGIRLCNDAYYFMKRQCFHLVLALVVGVAVALFDYHHWRRQWGLTVAFAVVVFLLLLVVFCFPPVNGSRRWISLGFIRLQPSELAKLVMVIGMSVWLDRQAWRVELFKMGMLIPGCFLAALCVPILAEPDFGAMMVVGLAGVLMMFVSGVRVSHILLLSSFGGCLFAYKLLTNSNRMGRLTSFMQTDVSNDQFYQLKQALVAIKNGGIFGVGLNQSMQKHSYLPEAHTDFIFAIGAEELGLLFSVGVILLYLIFLALSVYIAAKASDRFGRFLVIGMAYIICFQAFFNIGVICGALPTKGMALPFFSYGGTNLLSAAVAVGTIFSVGLHSAREKKRAFSHFPRCT